MNRREIAFGLAIQATWAFFIYAAIDRAAAAIFGQLLIRFLAWLITFGGRQ